MSKAVAPGGRATRRCEVLTSADDRRHAVPAAHGRGLGPVRSRHVDFPLGPSLEHLFERNATFQAGQRRSNAEVRTAAERQVTAGLAVDVEAVGILKMPFIAV